MGDFSSIKTPTVSDDRIIELFFERNEAAISETDKKYGKFLFRMIFNILNDRLDSEECLNDTYIGVWNNIPPTRPTIFPSFISRIARNIAINKYKEKRRIKRIPSEMTVSLEELEGILYDDMSPIKEYQSETLKKLINSYLDSLSQRQRYIFIGRFYMGDKLEVIADELDISISKVHREIKIIKQELKSHLERSGIYV